MNWFNLRQDFDKFTNQLRTKFNQAIEKSTKKNTNITTNSSNSTRENSNNNEQVSKKKYKTNNLYRSRETKNKHLKTFIDTTEKQLFEPKNIKRVRRNLTYEERKALAELKSMENTVVRIQDKGSRFVLLTNEDYENKVEHQIARSSLKELSGDPSQEFERKVKLWIDKWQSNKTLSNDWVKFITPEHIKPGKMYSNINTHKINNPGRVITSGYSAAVESLSILVEQELYKLAQNLPSGIKDTNDMLNIIDNLNNNCIPENIFLISFDVVNVSHIHNESGINSVERLLKTSVLNLPTLCILEALRLSLECNNSMFNKSCLVLIVILLWQCMMRKQWTTHSNL